MEFLHSFPPSLPSPHFQRPCQSGERVASFADRRENAGGFSMSGAGLPGRHYAIQASLRSPSRCAARHEHRPPYSPYSPHVMIWLVADLLWSWGYFSAIFVVSPTVLLEYIYEKLYLSFFNSGLCGNASVQIRDTSRMWQSSFTFSRCQKDVCFNFQSACTLLCKLGKGDDCIFIQLKWLYM